MKDFCISLLVVFICYTILHVGFGVHSLMAKIIMLSVAVTYMLIKPSKKE